MVSKKKTPDALKPTATPKPAATPKAVVAPKTATAPKPAARKAAAQRKRTPKPAGADQPTVTVSDEDIRIRAYFLSIEYRGNNRNDVDFWLLAERELRGK